jgi:hypothetical protein
MGLRPESLPEHFLNKMSKADRNGVLTAAEAQLKEAVRTERQEQSTFANWLNLAQGRGELYYTWSRTDKRSTLRPGFPDFAIFLNGRRTVFIEMKGPAGILSKEQTDVAELLGSLGFLYCVIATAGEGIHIIKSLL